MDKFLVIGSGSAGRRHALGLRGLFPASKISLIKRSNSAQPLDAVRRADIELLATLDEGIATQPDFVVIASPATLHRSDLECLSKCCQSFLLEKPIAASSDDARAIQNLVGLRRLNVTVGHHLRFSDTPMALRDAISTETKNKAPSLSLKYGQHLRHWRPSIQASSSVTALKELGGGVLRELSHEIDAVSYLLERPNVVTSALLQFEGAPTDGLVETIADFSLDGPHSQSRIHLDMTTDEPFRHWEAVFEEFTLRANLLEGTVSKVFVNGATEWLFSAKPGERDRAERALLSAAILGSVHTSIEPCNIAQGTHILNTIEAIEESASSGLAVTIAK